MKKLLLLTSVLTLSACGSLSLGTPNCYQSVAIAKISLGQAYSTAADLNTAEKISVDSAEKALTALDKADSLVTNASALCPLNEKAAGDLLEDASELLNEATITLGDQTNG